MNGQVQLALVLRILVSVAGGDYVLPGSGGPACCRHYDDASNSDDYIGFRLALFM